MADISKITLPSNDEYNIKDATARQNIAGKQDAITVDGILQGDGEGNISAADTQEVSTLVIDSAPTSGSNHLVTSGGVYTAIQNAGGGGGTDLPSQTGHSGEFLTTDGNNTLSWSSAPVTSVNSKTGTVTLSNTDVGAAATSHTHGKIQNNGTLQTTDVSIENGDKLVVTDANSTTANQIVRSNISFDGSTTSKYLSQKGTWESLPTDNDHRDSGYGQIKAGTASSSTSAITANTTTAQASTYNELLTINPGNKWVSVAANNSSTSGSDTFTIGHSAGLTAKTTYGSTSTTASANGGSITVTDIKYDEAGHITSSTDRTITLSQSTTPANHASTDTTYGVGNASNYGHVKLSDSTSSTSSTTGGIAATPAAVKAAYDLANGKQASITASGILKGNGSGTISAAVADTDYISLTGLNTKLNRNSAVTAAAANASGTEDTTTNTLYMVRGEAFNTTETTPTYNGQICWTIE